MRITGVGDLVSKYSFTISSAFCFDVTVLKTTPLDGVIHDIITSTSFPTFLALETYNISLSNDIMALDNCPRAEIFIQLQNSIRYFASPCRTWCCHFLTKPFISLSKHFDFTRQFGEFSFEVMNSCVCYPQRFRSFV